MAPATVVISSAAAPLEGAGAGARLGNTPSGTGPPTGAASAAVPPLIVPITLSPLEPSSAEVEGVEAVAAAIPTAAKKMRARTTICFAIF